MLRKEQAGPLTAAQHDPLQRIRHNCQELERLLTTTFGSHPGRKRGKAY